MARFWAFGDLASGSSQDHVTSASCLLAAAKYCFLRPSDELEPAYSDELESPYASESVSHYSSVSVTTWRAALQQISGCAESALRMGECRIMMALGGHTGVAPGLRPRSWRDSQLLFFVLRQAFASLTLELP